MTEIAAVAAHMRTGEWRDAIAQLHQLAHDHETAGKHAKAFDTKLQAALMAGMFRFLHDERSAIVAMLDQHGVQRVVNAIGCAHAASAASMLDTMFGIDRNTLPILQDLADGIEAGLQATINNARHRDMGQR